MSQLVDPRFKEELLQFGVKDWNDCFHCGNCTAICPLTDTNSLFPRKVIRQAQMGLKSSLSSNVDPWLCYYCGECTESCPRDANPGELMMSLRRYLTSVYDWTGLSKKFYTSHIWEYGAILFFAALVIALFAIFLPPSARIFTDPAAFLNFDGGVMINSLVENVGPHRFVQLIETGDLIMAGIVAVFLFSNIFNMFLKVVVNDKSVKVPFFAYLTEAWSLIYNLVTQAKFSKCEKKSYWAGHFLLMSGYIIMFTVVVAFIKKFQTEEVLPWFNWQRILGYYATFGILFFLIYVTIGRIRKGSLKMKFSHSTDWLFIVMLGLTTITGILVHIFRVTGMPAATYFTYVVHLAVLVPMIMVEVAFSKWSHLAYRPFAIYFSRLKKAALSKQYKTGLATA